MSVKVEAYLVVEFLESNSVAVIPDNWLMTQNTCVWPNWQSSNKLAKAITGHVTPEGHWEIFSIKVLKATGMHT